MREMTLRDIQKESISLLRCVDEFCQREHINYSLGYGALIGAIRHKGCIPWDDDIDIIMTRDEYAKFTQLFPADEKMQSEGLKLYAAELGNCYFSTARICSTKNTFVMKSYQWTDEPVGIWLDLFVIDVLPTDSGVGIRKQSKLMFCTCCAATPLSFKFDFTRNLKILARKIMYVRRDRIKEIGNYLKMIEALPKFETATRVCNFSSPYGYTDFHDKHVFDEYIRVPFENIEVSIIAKYDEYLRSIYGDYLQLPPENKRKRGHTANKFYWINK